MASNEFINDDDLQIPEGHAKAAEVIRKSSNAVIINRFKTMLWYLDDSSSMQTLMEQAGKDEYVSRVDVMKSALKPLVTRRLAEFPDSQLSLFRFDTTVKEMRVAKEADKLIAAIDGLQAGGYATNISSTFEHMLDYVKDNPNQVGVYHAQLITDAGDYISDSTIQEYEERFKKAGIILEVCLISTEDATKFSKEKLARQAKIEKREQEEQIEDAPKFSINQETGEVEFDDDDFVDSDVEDGDEDEDEDYRAFVPTNATGCAEALARLAYHSGGTFRVVSSAEQLTQGMIQAGTRLCLPPAPGK